VAAAGRLTRLRFPIALIAAFIISATVFGFLRALTLVRGEFGDVQQAVKIEFTRLRQDTEVEEKRREKAERSKAQQAPPPPMVTAARTALDPSDTAGDVTAIATLVEQQAALSGDLSSSGGADRDAVPLVRIEPEYPMQARQNGIEGWVVVEFTISTAGTVKDVVVVASEPGTVFDRAALGSVRKWKYNPKIVDGRPVERPGIKVRLDFEMEG
jgi:protein TonB